MNVGHYTGAITIEDVRDATLEMIYYSAVTCWWTHDPHHLGSVDNTPGGLPCDPRGGVLFQTDDFEGFLRAAEENPEHYGKHGLRAFMAAHHLNTVVSEVDRRSTCFKSWDEYNQMIDEADRRGGGGVTLVTPAR